MLVREVGTTDDDLVLIRKQSEAKKVPVAGELGAVSFEQYEQGKETVCGCKDGQAPTTPCVG